MQQEAAPVEVVESRVPPPDVIAVEVEEDDVEI